MSDNQVPRRAVLEQLTTEELAIYDTIQAIEKLGADSRLTNIIVQLTEAKNNLSDYVDGVPLVERPLTRGQELVGFRFNPSGLNEVDKAKQLSADLIDIVLDNHDIKIANATAENPITYDRNILKTLAVTTLVQAQMAVVKILTWTK